MTVWSSPFKNILQSLKTECLRTNFSKLTKKWRPSVSLKPHLALLTPFQTPSLWLLQHSVYTGGKGYWILACLWLSWPLVLARLLQLTPHGTPDSIIQPLQTLQTSAASLVFRSWRTQHCTPLLRKLHWLPLTERIRFKVCCLCFKVVTGSAPVNISKLLHVYTPSRTLRSSPDTRRFAINHCKRKQHGFRSFAHYGPHIWNDLPYDTRHCDTLS